jgi:hypothetical protein
LEGTEVKLKISRGAPLAAAAFAAMFAACDDDGGSQEAEVISAINILDNAGLHDIDVSINEEDEIPADARTVALHLQAVVQLTEWPSDLEDDAEALGQTFADLAAALEGEDPDMEQAGALAAKAHDDGHDFSGDVWAYLQEEAGIETAEDREHSE